MKKFLALALSCSLALTILAGCGGGDTSSTPAPEDTTPAETTGGRKVNHPLVKMEKT